MARSLLLTLSSISFLLAGAGNAWDLQEDVDSMTDKTNIYLHVSSQEAGEYAFMDRPSLWIRCVDDTTALIVSMEGTMFGDIYGDEHVLVRVDDEKAFKKTFERSNDFDSFGLWNGARAIPFIKSLFGKSELKFRVEPAGQSVKEVTFLISDLEREIEPLRRACGW